MRRYGGNWEVQMWTKIAAMVGSVLLIAFAAVGQDSSVPEIKFRAVADFLKLPADMYFGEVAGVATDSKGDVYVFSRGNTTGPAYGAAAAQLLEFGPDGKDRKSTRLNSSHMSISYAVFCLKKKNILISLYLRI